MMMYLIERLEYDDDVVADQRRVKLLKMLSKDDEDVAEDVADRKGQSTEDVAEVFANRKVKILKMLLIERSKY